MASAVRVDGIPVVRTLEDCRREFEGETTIGLDLETTGFSPWKAKIAVIGLWAPTRGVAGVLHYPHGKQVPQDVLRWLESFPEIVTHNGAQFDILFLANAGMDVEKVRWYDTLIGEQTTITAGRRGIGVSLKKTVKRRFGKELDKSIDHRGWGNEELNEGQLAYVVGDLAFLTRTKEKHDQRAAESAQMRRAIDFEMELLPVVVEMELHGLPIDMGEYGRYMATIEPKIERTAKELQERLGKIKLTSVPQVRAALAEKFGARAFPDTKAERFEEYVRFGGEIAEISALMLEFRGADQRRKMFSQKWIEEHVVDHGYGHRVHGKFWQVGTDTGRFSSSNPNLQQVPRDARHVYGSARSSWSVGKIDYSQIEVRVAAALASDMAMIEAINEGLDVHTFVASEAFGIPMEQVTKDQRKAAKAMNFLLLFGGGVDSLYSYATAEGSTITREEIEVAYDAYFRRFKGIARMKARAESQAATRRPVTLVYPSGLKRVIMGGELKATTILNNIVQGTAAFGLKRAMILARERGLSRYLSAVVHDETVLEAPTDEIQGVLDGMAQCMVDGMEWALEGCPPIVVGVESTWGRTWKGDPENDQAFSRLVNGEK